MRRHVTLGKKTCDGSADVGPNITGTLNPVCQEVDATAPSGAFSRTTGGGMTGYEFAIMKTNFVFDASDSSSIYGSASTVQPSSIRTIPCIKA